MSGTPIPFEGLLVGLVALTIAGLSIVASMREKRNAKIKRQLPDALLVTEDGGKQRLYEFNAEAKVYLGVGGLARYEWPFGGGSYLHNMLRIEPIAMAKKMKAGVARRYSACT